MPTINQLKKILGQTEKSTVRVEVSGKYEELTDTQSIRFEELAKIRGTETPSADRNPLEESEYSLEDAALRLMATEDELIGKAAAGSIILYADATGLSGHWQHRDTGGEIHRSAEEVMKSGLLALEKSACQQLANADSIDVTVLDYHSRSDPTTLKFDSRTLTRLVTSGPGSRRFFLRDPLQITRGDVLLLPPLVL